MIMRMNGKKVSGFNEKVVVLPRTGTDPETGEQLSDLVFRLRPVTTNDKFNTLCPEPKPPYITPAGETTPRPDLTDEEYRSACRVYNKRQNDFIMFQSIAATPGLVFETVKEDDPETWGNWHKELFESGISWVEIGIIADGVAAVNTLNDQAIQKATEAFLATEGLARVKSPASQKDGQVST